MKLNWGEILIRPRKFIWFSPNQRIHKPFSSNSKLHMPSSQPRIAIIGGGPAGLTAGVFLHKHNVPFTIFELRHKPTTEEFAQPSGMLDLHEESGLAAIKSCDLLDDFMPLTGDCAQVMKIADKDGNDVFTHESSNEDRPEISRNALNQLLLSKLPSHTIKWGQKLLQATSSIGSGHTKIDLDFGGQGKETFDLVIGADGAWSKVRQALTNVKPHYVGRQIITLTIRQITRKYPHLAELVGAGTFAALGTRHGVISQRGPLDSARIYIFITTTDEHFATVSGLRSKTAASGKDKLLSDNALLGQWGPKIKELVTVACDEESADNPGINMDIRPVFALPIEHSWEHNPGATLVGDAAHLMPPSGEGVNIAMLNSVLLSQAIIEAHATAGKEASSFQSALDPLIKKLEVEMVARGKAEAEQSQKLGETMFAEEGAAAIVEWFKSMK
jgi:2-polyprenyl-6-methoxyphenol hydroxylase-like FAD-dependent oxidoreductase